MCGGGGGDGGAADREAARQVRIRSGLEKINDTFSGFDDEFFAERGQAFTDFSRPQLDRQFSDAQDDLTFALSRNNRLDSSVAAKRRAELGRDFDIQRTNLQDKANQVSNEARNAVEGSRSNLVSLNANLADPNRIAQEASSRLAGLQAADTFDPLAPLFVNVGEGLGTQADLERRGSARFNSGLFTPSAAGGSSGSGRVIK